MGGVVFLTAIGLLAFWLLLRKRRQRTSEEQAKEAPGPGFLQVPTTHYRQNSQTAMLSSGSFSPPVSMVPLPNMMTGNGPPPDYFDSTPGFVSCLSIPFKLSSRSVS